MKKNGDIKIENSNLINCIRYYLSKRADPNGMIKRKVLLACLGIGFHIPKEHQTKIVVELERFGVISSTNRDWFRVY